jgi:hypothetical protein
MPMNNRILRPLARPLLLDAVPGAAAAYSLRQLSNAYTGPVVTVRRSSDNAEADFKASEIDDGTLAAFCGAGDGLVKTWHDQSGNGRDASQATAADQPKIVDSGSLVTEGGKPALEFDGTDDRFTVSSSTATFAFMHKSPSATFSVARFSDTANPSAFLTLIANGGEASNKTGIFFSFNDSAVNNGLTVVATRNVIGTAAISSTVADVIFPTEQTLLSILLDPSNAAASERLTHYFDGAFVDDVNTSTLSVATGNATSDLMIGAYPPGSAGHVSGTISELIIYPSDQTANRERIEGDINRHFGIF